MSDKRNTVQRTLVLEAVRELRCHATAEEIFEKVRRTHPGISRGTVYRNLHRLVEEGEIRKVELPDGPDRFDHVTKDHYHIRCRRCGRLFDVEMDVISDLSLRVKDTRGFRFEGYSILFTGICPDCDAAEE